MLLDTIKNGIYFILPQGLPTDEVLALAASTLAGGIGMLQYREKEKPARLMVTEVEQLLTLTRPLGVPLIINDRVDVALACGADGVHLGLEDMPVGIARELLGPGVIVGATTPDAQSLLDAESQGASYVAIGPAFASPTKPDKAVAGLDAIRRTVAQAQTPVCAIGGIDALTLPRLLHEGITLYAVISGIAGGNDPEAAACRLVELASAS